MSEPGNKIVIYVLSSVSKFQSKLQNFKTVSQELYFLLFSSCLPVDGICGYKSCISDCSSHFQQNLIGHDLSIKIYVNILGAWLTFSISSACLMFLLGTSFAFPRISVATVGMAPFC